MVGKLRAFTKAGESVVAGVAGGIIVVNVEAGLELSYIPYILAHILVVMTAYALLRLYYEKVRGEPLD